VVAHRLTRDGGRVHIGAAPILGGLPVVYATRRRSRPVARSASYISRPVADGWSQSTASISKSVFEGASDELMGRGMCRALSEGMTSASLSLDHITPFVIRQLSNINTRRLPLIGRRVSTK
jgi:hypothetical protein